MSLKTVASVIAISLLAGCASVSMESKEKSEAAKKFAAPSPGNAGLYVYRSGSFGAALKRTIWVDDKCLGQSAPNVFFYTEVKGDTEHKVSTESEFSPNDLMVKVTAGTNYFVRQFIKMGLVVGGSGVELVDEAQGKKDVAGLEMATPGMCGSK